jgi:hypothetical protein
MDGRVKPGHDGVGGSAGVFGVRIDIDHQVDVAALPGDAVRRPPRAAEPNNTT